ncbi:MAG: hypothetical protein V4454_08635 [Pseudomonadota bacterium]
MTTIYLDYNVISTIGGIPQAADASEQRNRVLELKNLGFQFSLSAWHMYELARSNNSQHIEQCCDFVEQLEPLWISNNTAVKRQEVDRYLQPVFHAVGPVRSRTIEPLHESVADMWASYGGEGSRDETFRASVHALRQKPEYLETVRQAAALTPSAIAAGRDAYRAGLLKSLDSMVDRAYFLNLVPEKTPHEQIEYLVQTTKNILAECPAIAVEEALTQLRLRDSFKPEAGDAADLQHAITPLAYCEYFVTGDKALHGHCLTAVTRAKVSCKVRKSVWEIKRDEGVVNS